MTTPFRILYAVLILCFLIPIVEAAESLQVGDPAPEWEQLTGTDDKPHSLSNLHDLDVIVVCFTCNTCPYSVDYEDRLIALQNKYVNEGAKVRLIAINSNGIAADDLEHMQRRAQSKKFNFAYLRDESQEVAKAFGAIYTPEFYVLNKERKIVYRGAMDDSTMPDSVKVRYVELAVAAALQGQLPEVTTTGARGCALRFKRVRR